MSSDLLQLIPTNPEYIPDVAAQEAAGELLVSLVPHAEEVTIKVTNIIRFFDAGANLERILCPNCKSKIPIEWWQQAMDLSCSTGFEILESKLPCCGAILSLNDLDYDWPQGFARFALAARDPNVKGITETKIRELETILGCSLRLIWSHY